MYNLNKKGLAEMVSIMLTISLVIVGVTLVFGIINNLTYDGLSPAFSCFDLQAQPPFEVLAGCTDGDQAIVTLSRSLTDSSGVSNLEFGVYSETGSVRYGCGTSSEYQCSSECILPSPGSSQEMYLDASSVVNENLVTISLDGCIIGSFDLTPC